MLAILNLFFFFCVLIEFMVIVRTVSHVHECSTAILFFVLFLFFSLVVFFFFYLAICLHLVISALVNCSCNCVENVIKCTNKTFEKGVSICCQDTHCISWTITYEWTQNIS